MRAQYAYRTFLSEIGVSLRAGGIIPVKRDVRGLVHSDRYSWCHDGPRISPSLTGPTRGT